MQILRYRPVATAAMVAMAATVIAFLCPAVFSRILWFVSLLLLVVTLITFGLLCKKCRQTARNKQFFLTVILTLGMLCLSLAQALYFFHNRTQIPQYLIDSETPCIIEGVVKEGNAGTGYSYYTLDLHALNKNPIQGKAELFCEYQVSFREGDVIRAQVTLQSPESFYEPESLCFALADGIRICLISEESNDTEILVHKDPSLKTYFSRWRANLSSRLLKLTGKQRGGLATALFLGDRSILDDRISTDFHRTGTSHLLALSGMHVTILMGMLSALTVQIGIPKRGRLLLLVLLALAYLALTGFRLSAIRAAGMLILFYAAQFIGSRADPLTTLCMIGWGILTLSPFSVADGGFWMSFAAVFGLVTVYPKYNEWLNSKSISTRFQRLAQAITASLIAVIAVSFCSWLFIGQISPIGILLTVVLTPILTVVLILIPLVLFLDILPFFSAVPLSIPLSFCLELMIGLTDRVSQWRNIAFSLQIPHMGIILGCMTIILLLMLILPLKQKLLLTLPPILATCCLIICTQIWNHAQYYEQLQLSYVVRSTGSILTVSDQEGTAIIDTSSGSFSMLHDAERAITAQGASEIEHLILTHYHRAYAYSVERLAKRWTVRTLWVPTPQNENDFLHLTALYERLTPLNTDIRCYGIGEQIHLFGDAVFHIANVSYLKRSTQPIVTYLLQTPQDILTFTSLPIQETEYYSTFRWVYDQTDVLIFGKHGPNPKQILTIPNDTSHPRLVLLDCRDLLPYFDLTPQSNVYKLPIQTDIQCFTFDITK